MPSPLHPGRPRVHRLREILDIIFSVVPSGGTWRLQPHEYSPWPTADHSFHRWRQDGTWERLNAALRERLRVRNWREQQPHRMQREEPPGYDPTGMTPRMLCPLWWKEPCTPRGC